MRKAILTSLCLSFRLFATKGTTSTGRSFVEFHICGFYSNLSAYSNFR